MIKCMELNVCQPNCLRGIKFFVDRHLKLYPTVRLFTEGQAFTETQALKGLLRFFMDSQRNVTLV